MGGSAVFFRAGKRLAKRVTDITIVFKAVPYALSSGEDVRDVRPNTLSFQIQPREGISMGVSSKPPGTRVRVQSVNMEFNYGSSFRFSAEAPEVPVYMLSLIDFNAELAEVLQQKSGLMKLFSKLARFSDRICYDSALFSN